MTEHQNINLTSDSATDFKIVIYSPFSKSTQKMLGHEVHFLNSNQFDRWDAFKMFPNSWVCFLDADCTLDKNLIAAVKTKLQNLCPSTVLCGRYKTEKSESTLSRAYNTLCNTWLEAGLLAGEPRLLGGFFAIYSSNNLRMIEFEKFPKWGAEDYRMARQLGKHNFKFKLSEELFTSHQSKNELSWFFKRAWIHGENRPADVSTNAKHWVKMIVRQNLFSMTYIMIHFGTVFASKSFNKTKQRTESLKAFFGFFSKERSGNQRI